MRPFLVLLPLLLLAACGGGGGYTAGHGDVIAARLDCVPFARALSGVKLHGDAADWWAAADGRYEKSQSPAEGAVLVFERSGRLPAGHVGVVSSVIDARTVLLTQANWQHNRVTIDQQAVDVSAGNDWTAVRVFWPPSGQLGTSVYRTYGFILPARARGHDELVSGAPRAIRVAENGG